jgi:predicted deacetylase
MAAKYIIRFDDICPTMNWDVWQKIEKILIQQRVNPILAVVPDNKDRELIVGEAHSGFWDKVRTWQARGWSIGIHGYQHLYVTDRAGLVPINNRSEFAGLNEPEQEIKLKNALAVFRRERVTPEIWVAPGHSFDAVTLRVLKKLGLNTVSDGFYLRPTTDSLGITYIPQQLWKLRPMRLGLWTVCYHHNGWTGEDIAQFELYLRRYKGHITNLHRVLKTYRIRHRTLTDALFANGCLLALQSRHLLRKVVPRAQ